MTETETNGVQYRSCLGTFGDTVHQLLINWLVLRAYFGSWDGF